MAHSAHTLFLVPASLKVTLTYPTYTCTLVDSFKGTVSHLWAWQCGMLWDCAVPLCTPRLKAWVSQWQTGQGNRGEGD
jgi:hypothetical protein